MRLDILSTDVLWKVFNWTFSIFHPKCGCLLKLRKAQQVRSASIPTAMFILRRKEFVKMNSILSHREILTRANELLEDAKEYYKNNISICNHLEGVSIYWSSEENIYGEPGYESYIVALGDWNSFQQKEKEILLLKEFQAMFEMLGIDCQWSDMWTTCDECGKLYLVHPDDMSWKPSIIADLDKGERVCVRCIGEFTSEDNRRLSGLAASPSNRSEVAHEDKHSLSGLAALPSDRNENGLTFERWLCAAGFGENLVSDMVKKSSELRKAWKKGVDPESERFASDRHDNLRLSSEKEGRND